MISAMNIAAICVLKMP